MELGAEKEYVGISAIYQYEINSVAVNLKNSSKDFGKYVCN